MVKNRFYRFIRATWRPFATFLHPLRVEGLENLPKDQPVLLCANHSSAVDPILLICAMRQDFPPADHGQEAADENSRGGSLSAGHRRIRCGSGKLRHRRRQDLHPEFAGRLESAGIPGGDTGQGAAAWMSKAGGRHDGPFAPACRWCRCSSAGTSACFTGCPSSSESPTTRYIPAGRERRRSISPTPRKSCVGPMRWEESNGRGKSSQKRRFLLRRGAGCEAGGGDSP